MGKALALVIEDQTNLAILYEDALRLVGFDVVAIHDGLEALNHLELNDAPNLIILDVNLPSLSGRDIHKHIRGTDKYAKTPVIILTANSLMIDKIRPTITSNDYVFVKPIGMKQLQDLAKAVRPNDAGLPDYMAKTQPIPHLDEPVKPNNNQSDAPPTELELPVVLRPDNTLEQTTRTEIVDPKAQTQEHKAILTPDDDILSQDDD